MPLNVLAARLLLPETLLPETSIAVPLDTVDAAFRLWAGPDRRGRSGRLSRTLVCGERPP
jgi:hypothetical protein